MLTHNCKMFRPMCDQNSSRRSDLTKKKKKKSRSLSVTASNTQFQLGFNFPMLHGFLMRDHFKNKMKARQNWAISHTLNESSKTIMRPYKKNATRKLIVKGHEARLCLSSRWNAYRVAKRVAS